MRLYNLLICKVESWQQGCLATIQIFFTITLVVNKRPVLQITEVSTAIFLKKVQNFIIALNDGTLSYFESQKNTAVRQFQISICNYSIKNGKLSSRLSAWLALQLK